MDDRPGCTLLLESLSASSLNRTAALCAAEYLDYMCKLLWPDLESLPLFNENFEAVESAAVTALKNDVLNSELIIIFTPEHSHGIPGALENAIDWLSRPIGDGCLINRFVAIATIGPPSQDGENVLENLVRKCGDLTDRLYPTTLRIPVARDSGEADLGDEATIDLYDWLDDLLQFTRHFKPGNNGVLSSAPNTRKDRHTPFAVTFVKDVETVNRFDDRPVFAMTGSLDRQMGSVFFKVDDRSFGLRVVEPSGFAHMFGIERVSLPYLRLGLRYIDHRQMHQRL
ncbi:MAG: NAD(P)H-dependent oxidoreductase [Acidimicrobiales bacterium]|nr:NAD(P)H-dependent oxidoreductase [Acidimicrobiales bacterium]